jgi:MiaB/RimO family radical SAM methylthiotransferase
MQSSLQGLVRMRTFSIDTLGCKVNQYESDQIATLLRARGLRQADDDADADLRIVNTCSVTVQAASKSRQAVRRAARSRNRSLSLPVLSQSSVSTADRSFVQSSVRRQQRQRVIVVGCWATSDRAQAAKLPGVDAVLGHHDDIAGELERLLLGWDAADDAESHRALGAASIPAVEPSSLSSSSCSLSPSEFRKDDGWIVKDQTPAATKAGDEPRGRINGERSGDDNKSHRGGRVNENLIDFSSVKTGTKSLPLLDSHQTGHQRAFLKVQDGCDAHCTYCIIPQLRPALWSKPLNDAVREAQALVDAGHREIVLTGIFLGAYGQPTALRRRQSAAGVPPPMGALIEALCTRVKDLRRLRLSSLEPGDLSGDLIDVLKSHPQVVPHFHLPLQSGSDMLLRRMNRQYTRDDFLRMLDAVSEAFDRPALTTDIIVGFPGETDAEFSRTLEVVDRARFIHIHAFSFSPRPGTAAARWTRDFVRGPIVNQRIDMLHERAVEHSLEYRRQFVGETVEVMVEREGALATSGYQHGRCERYFPVHFASERRREGELVNVRIERVTAGRTVGAVV